jgi:hypothetical protein
MSANILLVVVGLLSGLLEPLKNRFAYLDPGSGSFIIQILIASLLGFGYLIKVYWKKIIAFFRKLFGKTEPEAVNEPEVKIEAEQKK